MAIHGRYIGINYANSRHALAGCINDATDWLAAHKRFLTSGELLLEQQATKAGILRFVKEALARLQSQDWLILQISGHGSYQPDATKQEPDGRNELFCPYDLDKNVIFDDEWYALLKARDPNSRVLFITDCCYSGSMARGIEKQKTKPRFVPFQMLAQGMHALHRERLYSRAMPRSEADGIAEGVVHLSGCKDNEVSYDAVFGSRANGAMSRVAIDSLRMLEPGAATFMDWYRWIRTPPGGLPSKFYPQTPQMNASDEWFSVVVPGFEVEPTPPPAAAGSQPPNVQLSIGEWELFRQEWRKRAA
ncbi:caspase family protein [Anatilimnocola floriformis]|uniref:caspase family protein n=1 Tax=Anatilimnocola floriformis TaxID=2948575 RepID=UPI0020C51CE5|nr:caspase family protein [Anatilimnocola floriformis]